MDPDTAKLPTTVRASMRDGMSYSVTIGMGETYFGAFAIFLSATAAQIGLLATLPQFLGAIAQGISLRLLQRQASRRRMIIKGALVQAATFLPIAALAFIPAAEGLRGALLIAFAAVYYSALGVTVPAWTSLIGDLIPGELRPRFFARRTRSNGVVSFLAIAAASQILDLSSHRFSGAAGFLVIFLIASLARVVSAAALAQHDDPPQQHAPEHYFSFYSFLRRVRHSNFTRFVLFVSTANFGVALAGPYFALYMLRDLQLSYSEFMLVTTAAVVAQFLSMRMWGAIAESAGSKAILNVCGYGIALVPALWLVSDNLLWLILIQFVSGLVWAGFNLASMNFMFDAVSSPKRARCSAYQGIVNGFFVLLGSLIGSSLIGYLPQHAPLLLSKTGVASPLPYLFLLSALTRLVAAVLLLPRFLEVRQVAAARSMLGSLRLAAMALTVYRSWRRRALL